MNNIEKNNNEFYCPVPIGTWRSFLETYMKDDKDHNLRSNLGYSLQYLDFLNNQIENRHEYHYTVQTLNNKTFVVTGMGVVEGILFFIVRGFKKTQSLNNWEKIETKSKTIKVGGVKEQIITIRKRQTTNWKIKNIKLVGLIDIVVNNKLIPFKNEEMYKNLTKLRESRNSVHIHDVQGGWDTDWKKFDIDKVNMTKKVLLSLFESGLFDTLESDFLDFIRTPIKK